MKLETASLREFELEISSQPLSRKKSATMTTPDDEVVGPSKPDAYCLLYHHRKFGQGSIMFFRSYLQENIDAFGYGKPSGQHADVADIVADIRSIGAHGRYEVSDTLDFTSLLLWGGTDSSGIFNQEIGEDYPVTFPDLIVGRVLVPKHWSLQMFVEVVAKIVSASAMLWMYDYTIEDTAISGVAVSGTDEIFHSDELDILPRLAEAEPA